VLVFGVLPGIVVGVVVSLLEVLRRAILPNTAVLGNVAGTVTYRDIANFRDATTLPGVIVYRFDAPLFFANVDVFRRQILALVDGASDHVRTVIVNAEGITDLDVTGAENLQRVTEDLRKRDVRLVLARVRTDLQSMMVALGVEDRVGRANFYLQVRDAVRAVTGAEQPPVTVEK
jgi:SulP family sulfate permease